MVDDVHTDYAKEDHATEINVSVEDGRHTVDVSVTVVGEENVATLKVGAVLLFYLALCKKIGTNYCFQFIAEE